MTPRTGPSAAPPSPNVATHRIWVTHCLFKKSGFPSLGTFGASESPVVIMKLATWEQLCRDVPQLQTMQFEVGSQE